MDKQKNLQKLFNKPMNRKQFLGHVGAGALTIIGVSGLLKSMLDYGGRPRQTAIDGYGTSAYGGVKK